MSAKPESRLWKTLRDGLTDVHWTRIESWASPGVPDVNGCAEFGEFWIELKVIKNNRIKLSPHQIAWHTLRTRIGGRSYILAREAAKTPLILFSGEQAKDLHDKKINEISPMAKIEHPYDWARFRKTLEKKR
jgi:Holliday junction resolvase|tara:strand:+ start:4024 stop:4419 length:396 start_codon:yes stop_codon:yes gene_type:complete